jgi:preprotein translocase subunit SecG
MCRGLAQREVIIIIIIVIIIIIIIIMFPASGGAVDHVAHTGNADLEITARI